MTLQALCVSFSVIVCQDEIDTSIWSPDIQKFTRLHYVRYGEHVTLQSVSLFV